LSAGVEYFTGSFGISHIKTVGTGACAGCSTPVCLLYSYARIALVNNVTGAILSTPANTADSHVATWQNGQISGLTQHCDANGTCTASFACGSQPTCANASTWNQVKTLYR